MKYLLFLTSLLFAIVGQLLLKKGILLSSLSPNFFSIVKTLFSPLVFLGFLSYGIGSIVWLFVLQKFPLSVAYPGLSLSYVIIVVASFLFLQEPLGALKILGVLFIISGVFLLFR